MNIHQCNGALATCAIYVKQQQQMMCHPDKLWSQQIKW